MLVRRAGGRDVVALEDSVRLVEADGEADGEETGEEDEELALAGWRGEGGGGVVGGKGG